MRVIPRGSRRGRFPCRGIPPGAWPPRRDPGRSPLRETLQGLQDQILNGPPFRGPSREDRRQRQPAEVRLQPRDGREVFAQARVDEGLAKGRCGRADRAWTAMWREVRSSGPYFRHHPGPVDGRWPPRPPPLRHGVGVAYRTTEWTPGVEADGRVEVDVDEAAQASSGGQVILRRIPVEEDAGIGGGVVEPVEGPELLAGERGMPGGSPPESNP